MSSKDGWKGRHTTVPREAATAIAREFEQVLNDAADERPLQTFLAAHGSLLSGLAQPGGGFWCLDRPRLGAELVPDFLLASETSIGILWTMIELESPTERALTRAGVPAKKLAEALKQVRDWRTWLTDNVAYARAELDLRDIESTCQAVVIIGRRSAQNPKQVRQYRALSTADTTIMSYDRLVDLIRQTIPSRGHKYG